MIFVNFIFAFEIKPYFFSVKENYKEYISNKVIDRDYNNFCDLSGAGIYLKQNFFKLNFEYAYGNATYKGADQTGKKLKAKERNVYLINSLLSVGKYIYFDLGYRFWDRGKSNYGGDYEEQYIWPYVGLSFNYNFYFSRFSVEPLIAYQNAFNPKLKILAGNTPDIKLGHTYGMKFELPLTYKIDNFMFFAFYRFQYWHIKASGIYNLILNNYKYPVFEPKSETKNQYIGIGLKYSF